MEQQRQHYALTLAVLAVAALAFALLQTMVAPALPAIQRDLGASPTSVTWVLTVYLLTASVATPVVGRMGDIFGKERVLVLVLAAFAAGSLLCALSSSIEVLVLGRAIQGAGGAVFPLAFGIIRDEFPRERVATGIGLISATFGVGGGAGLVLSGVIVDNLDYTWIFWLGLAMTLAAIVATHLFVPASPVRSPAKIDWAGAAMLSAGLVCLLLAVSEGSRWGWTSPEILALLAGSGALLGVWARFELRVPQPLVDMRLLRTRGVWTTNLTALLTGFGMFGGFILTPAFVQAPESSGYGFGVDVLGAGLFLLPSSMVMLFAGPLAGGMAARFGSKVPLLLGTALTALSFAMLAGLHDERWHIYLAVAIQGLGIGLSFAATANLIVEAVPQRQMGEATGINTIMRTVGGALGAQLMASIVAGHLIAGVPAESGYVTAFALGAAALTVALVAGALIPGRRTRVVAAPAPA